MNRDDAAAQCAASPEVRVNFFEHQRPAERTFTSEADALAEFLDLLDLERQRKAIFGPGSRR